MRYLLKTPMREVTRRTCVIMEIEDMTTQTQATEPLENEGERTEKAKCIPQDTILIGEVEINPYHPELKVIERLGDTTLSTIRLWKEQICTIIIGDSRRKDVRGTGRSLVPLEL
ncbi:hypothetical protein YC2023_067309 [Brassica napus]